MKGRLWLIAQQEFSDALAARWLAGLSGLFALLTVAISYFGMAGIRDIGFQGFDLVSASLLNLVLFVVPLAGLVQGGLAQADQGSALMLLLTQPVTRRQVLLGRYLGLLLAVMVSILGGLALGGLIVLTTTSLAQVGHFALLMLVTALLIPLFLALGLLIGIVWDDRARVLGIGLSIWFAMVLLYDLVVVGLLIGSGLPLKTFLIAVLALNPVDAARVFYLLATGNSVFVGPTGAVLSQLLGAAWGQLLLIAILIGWTVGSLWAAERLFRRRDF